MPLPERDRRDAAGEVLREVSWPAASTLTASSPRLPQQLVQRGVAADREADERRVERERDERRDRQAEPLPVDVDRDDGDAGRDAPHHCAKLVAADHAAMIRAV